MAVMVIWMDAVLMDRDLQHIGGPFVDAIPNRTGKIFFSHITGGRNQ